MDLWKLLEKQDIEGLNEAAITGRLDDHLYMYHMPYSYTAEQIRKIRTYLFHMPDKTPPRILMVTSALPSEGKTVIASNLAISIAKGEDQHVLLVECDLRKPSMYTLFKYPPSKGVAEILQGTANVAECLIKTPIDKLTILPAAKESPANPSELLESKKMSQLIQELAQRYTDRFLIIDTSPIQATVDPKIIADQVEGIIVVARYRYTRESDFRMALESLPRNKILGTVLNAVDELPAKKYKYKKYNYHKYY
ncbi:MAG: CpsD/CapB family tyrosine-protein kinase [Desulfomonilia bacterium]|jgi:protein-tyrosine kinase|uniref:non-specific protein-tyrosine kinase n=1 Tax=anaerobic digester metagenome TaxID=1263854 RepID=A0A485M308_9ZZZZ|nr:CpsD/CapB family tyrosine-protein kinase [Deltaproteobacteria bacterium]HPD22062.1 CpsD/CapB family tyrosine-protein kinase [Deltaproteobacteria bacterium]HRS56886.1 CpsD/CapB family tyrosine-protein kinase [Desulfomonilia bacterium]HRV36457.1 CpsD/CapB family tyrosine-protein kinase [Desulfomonilia bacterium]